MRLRAFLIATVTLVTLCGHPRPAHAAQLTGGASAWAVRVKSRVPAPTGAPIDVEFGDCPSLVGADGCNEGSTIYLAPQPTPFYSHFTFLHELGHVFDARDLNDLERTFLSGWLGPRDTGWADCGNLNAPRSYGMCPKERFADAYAACALGMKPDWRGRNGMEHEGNWFTTYSWYPSRQTNAIVCQLIREYA